MCEVVVCCDDQMCVVLCVCVESIHSAVDAVGGSECSWRACLVLVVGDSGAYVSHWSSR